MNQARCKALLHSAQEKVDDSLKRRKGRFEWTCLTLKEGPGLQQSYFFIAGTNQPAKQNCKINKFYSEKRLNF